MTAYDFPPPPAHTHTEQCESCGWTTKPGTPARTRKWMESHKCGSVRSRRSMGLTHNVRNVRTSAHVAEDVEFILDWDNPWTTPLTLARRLGYKDTGGLYIALRRAHRDDLLARLDRNARVAS